jgi:IS30 family transposase
VRGIKREIEKEKVEDLLREGVPPAEISRKLNIPLSTITTWLKSLREDNQEIIACSSSTVYSVFIAKMVNKAEAELTNIITPYITVDISDDDWMDLGERIADYIKNLIASII